MRHLNIFRVHYFYRIVSPLNYSYQVKRLFTALHTTYQDIEKD